MHAFFFPTVNRISQMTLLVFSRSLGEHEEHFKALREPIKREGFRLKFMKCNFARRKMQHLEHVIEENNFVRDFLIRKENIG